MRGMRILMTLAGLCAGSEHVLAATTTVSPAGSGSSSLAVILERAADGDRIILGEGRYELEPGIQIAASRLTVEGSGPDKTVLAFKYDRTKSDRRNEPALVVAGNGVLLGNFSVTDAPGPAIAAKGVNRLTIRHVAIKQSLGLHANGPSMNIRIFSSKDVLLDHVDSRHASVSGAQISQSERVIVKDSHFEANSTGLEIENDYFVDVFGNSFESNATGLLFLDNPAYPHTGGRALRAFHNEIGHNNRESVSFGRFSRVNRTGTGILIMGAVSDVHIFENRISENGHASVLLLATPWPIEQAEGKAVPNDVVIRNNVFGRSSFKPLDNLMILREAGQKLADVIWDGATNYIAAGTVKSDAPLRLTMRHNVRVDGNAPSFLSMGQSFANGGMLMAEPSSAVPEVARTTEPAPVQIAQQGSRQ